MTTTLTLPYLDAVDVAKRLALTVGTRPVMPVLTCALLRPADSDVTSTDLESWTTITLPVDSAVGDPALVPVVTLVKLLRAVKPTGAKATREAVARITLDDGKITVECDGRCVTDGYNGLPEDFPKVPEDDTHLVGEWWADEFGSGLTFVEHAVSRDDTLPMLTSIRVEIAEAGGLAFAATDRYRLAVIDLPGEGHRDVAMLVPHRACKAIRALRGSMRVYAPKQETGDRYDGGWLKLVVAGTVLWVRLLGSTFPPFRSLLPTGQRDVWTVDRARLLGDVKALATALDKHTPVRVQFRPGSVQVGDCQPIPADSPDGDQSYLIGFNPAFLQDAVAVWPTGQVTVSIGAANKPVVFGGVDAAGVSLLMPVRLDVEAAA